jgi:hypothetical protein
MTLHEISNIADAERGPAWENQFFQALAAGRINLLSEEPQTGPDQWPYLLAETSVDATEPVAKVLPWLAERGIGLALNPRKEYPDYVFSYGMLWSFKETGFFFKPTEERKVGAVEFSTEAVKQSGPPTEEFLPSYVRKILREFFRDQGLLRPRILVMSTEENVFDLVFSLESLGNPPEPEHQGIAEAIGWFLPPHYSLLLISEKGLPPFSDL